MLNHFRSQALKKPTSEITSAKPPIVTALPPKRWSCIRVRCPFVHQPAETQISIMPMLTRRLISCSLGSWLMFQHCCRIFVSCYTLPASIVYLSQILLCKLYFFQVTIIVIFRQVFKMVLS